MTSGKQLFIYEKILFRGKNLTAKRLDSLDAFRGLTIAGMILVNNPASWKYVYPPLRHAEWHGWTPTDLIFPFFIFIVGVSISLALSRRKEKTGARKPVYLKIFKRTVIIFSLGIILHLIPHFNFATLRIPGVLQRIALCYLFAALIFLKTGTKARIGLTFAFLALYWLIMRFVPVPGFGAGVWDYRGNLCAYIDMKLLSGHLYRPDFDPEGLLSTVPAIATALLGTLAGDWLRSSRNTAKKTLGLITTGIVLTLSGLILHPFFPINKQLWTSTYVLFAGGVALLFLGLFAGIINGLRWKKWSYPFIVIGANAITIFVGSSLMTKLLAFVRVQEGPNKVGIVNYLYNHLLSPLAGPYIGSLIYPLLLILFWVGIMIPLHRKKVFIKI